MSQAQRMMELLRGFSAAHGTYSVEEYNEAKRKAEIKGSARTVRQPVTEAVWAQHISGTRRLGIITITEENTCWWGAVDIDDYEVDHTILVSKLADMNLPALVTRTKSGGAHVWLFFSEPVPARIVMPKLRELAAALGYGDCEVFPKQIRVVSEGEGFGNWLNMPYFGGDQAKNYGVRADGLGYSLDQWLTKAESLRMTEAQFQDVSVHVSVRGWEDAPPCLEHLAGVRVREGVQNNALFNFGVLARKMREEGWEELVLEWNRQFFVPPHPVARLTEMLKRVGKRDYNYKCHDAPCVSHCNMPLCRTRKYGIGPGGGADIIDSVSILMTEPPMFYVLLKTGGTVECDGGTLLNPRAFQEAVLVQHQIVVPQYKQEVWLPRVQQYVESAIRIDAPAEVGVTGRMWELVEQFCTDRHAAESVDEVFLGKPWRDEDEAMVWFRLRDLRDHLDRARFTSLRVAQITERIKKAGGRSHFFNVRGRGVNVWGVPVSQLSWHDGRIHTPAEPDQPL